MGVLLCFLIVFFVAPYYLANNLVHRSVQQQDYETKDDDYIVEEPEMPPFVSATSLEALVLDAVRLAGTAVCSSPFAREVMRGTYRNESPTPDEMEASVLLRRTCIHEIRSDPEQNWNTFTERNMPYLPNPDDNNTDSEIQFQLLPESPSKHRGFPSVSRERVVPGVKASGKSQPDAATLQQMKAIIEDKSADCKARKVPVEIPPENGIVWLPKCALVERCGGCCPHNGLTHCVPAPGGITTIKKKVVATNSKGTLLGIKQVSVEKHTKCKCDCKVKETDCDKETQKYEPRNCRCVCKETRSCSAPTYWDERTCKCKCPQHLLSDCSTGAYYDSSTCRCATALEILKMENTRRMNQGLPEAKSDDT